MYGNGVNTFITHAIGVLLVCIPTLLLFQVRIEERVANRPPTMKSFAGMSVIGLLAGALVGMTSVGSGSIIMMLLLMFYSYPPKVMVGTDIVHAVILTGVTSMLHWRLGQCESHIGSLAVDRLHSGWFVGFSLEHQGSSSVVETDPLLGVAGHRGPDALGLNGLK